MCTGHYLRLISWKHHYGIFWVEIHLPFNSRQNITLSLIRRYHFDLDKNETRLIHFLNDLNAKHASIKFECKNILKKKVKLLDTLYKDKNDHFQTTLYKKPTNRQNYLHSKSEHPYALKKSMAFTQVLRINRTSSHENKKPSPFYHKKFFDRK